MAYSMRTLCTLAYNNLEYAPNWAYEHNKWSSIYRKEVLCRNTYQAWDPTILQEFLRDSKSKNWTAFLRFGIFSDVKLGYIKDNWSKVLPFFRDMAANPSTFLPEQFYEDYHRLLEEITHEDGKNGNPAAIRRLAVYLQPNVFGSAIVDSQMQTTKDFLNQYLDEEIEWGSNWYADSNILLRKVHQAFPEADTDARRLVLNFYPWALCALADWVTNKGGDLDSIDDTEQNVLADDVYKALL